MPTCRFLMWDRVNVPIGRLTTNLCETAKCKPDLIWSIELDFLQSLTSFLNLILKYCYVHMCRQIKATSMHSQKVTCTGAYVHASFPALLISLSCWIFLMDFAIFYNFKSQAFPKQILHFQLTYKLHHIKPHNYQLPCSYQLTTIQKWLNHF